MPIRTCQALRLNSCGCSFTGGLANRAGLHRGSWPPSSMARHSGTRRRSLKSCMSSLKWLVPQEKRWDCLLPPVLALGAPDCLAGGDLAGQPRPGWPQCEDGLFKLFVPSCCQGSQVPEHCWLIDEEQLSELQQCPRAWGRGWRACSAMLSAGGQLSGRVRSALDFFLVINFILLVFLSSLAVYQVQHLFMGRVLVLCLTFAVSWLDSSSDILV